MIDLNRLSITERYFNELYPDLKGYYDFFNDAPVFETDLEFEQKYLSNKLWRLNNIYSITDKFGDVITFRMNPSQHRAYAAARQHPRLIILKSRQQGISTLWLVSYFDDAVFAPNFSIGLMAQGTEEASTLLERTKFLWDNLDDSVKAFANVGLAKSNTKEFSFTNNSSIFIRVSFRSATLQRLHVSEMGKIANNYPKRAKEVKTGTLQALAKGNTGIIESTAEGNNDFKVMWDKALVAKSSGQMTPKDFYPLFLSWVDDPDCVMNVAQTIDKEAEDYFAKTEKALKRKLTDEQKWWWIAQRRELGGDIYQEYPATPEEAFRSSRDGTFYSRLFNEKCVEAGHVVQGLYDPNLPVTVHMDLGVDDTFVMGFVQWYDGHWRIVDEYFNDGYALTHYLDVALATGYNITTVKFPHDIKVRELGKSDKHGRAVSRLDTAKEWKRANGLDWNFVVNPRSSVEDGIEAVRRMIPRMYIDARCEYLISCFHNYSKEFDDRLHVWKRTPKHDEFSHGADVLRGIAGNTSERDYQKPTRSRSRNVNSPFSV